MATYQIALVSQGLAGLRDMSSVTGYDPQSEFLEYSEVVGRALSAKPVEQGFPRVKWMWEYLSQTAFDALAQYCSGTISSVYIRTRVNTGTAYSYPIYSGIMVRPRGKTIPGYLRQGVEVEFLNLVLV